MKSALQHSAQWSQCHCACISFVDATLSNALNPGCSWGVTPADHDPLGVWTCLRGICKEFLITLYVWGALNSCVKLHRLVHLKTHHASASDTPNQSRAAQVYQGDTSALHIVFIFSTLWLPKFDLLSVFWGLAVWKIHACIHTLEGFVVFCFFPWTLGAFNKNIS